MAAFGKVFLKVDSEVDTETLHKMELFWIIFNSESH